MRLFPVVATATLFSLVLMFTGLMFHLDISQHVRNYDFLLGYFNFEPTIRNVISNIFLNHFGRAVIMWDHSGRYVTNYSDI